MSTPDMTLIDRLQIDHALWGSTEESERKLQRALQAAGSKHDPSWEHSAAVATVALQLDDPGAPPQRLMESLRASASAHFGHAAASPRRLLFAAWPLAAAALTVAAVLWWQPDTVSVSEMRRTLTKVPSAAVWSWEPGTAKGDVVWDGASQQGYMRFASLPVNDPSLSQYQLWIVDAKRNPAYPVDGGVFDISPGQTEIMVPVAPSLFVHDAQAFVVTVESPGGVVVSDRNQVVALAKTQ